jgi:hypothetical protein
VHDARFLQESRMSLPADRLVHCSGFAALVRLTLGASFLFFTACEDDQAGPRPLDMGVEIRDAGPADHSEGLDASPGDGDDSEAGGCMLQELAPALEGGNHIPACMAATHTTNPPASGSHYPVWPFFRAYDKPVPWGYLLHAMEHGVVVIAYNCPDGCAADVAAATAVMEAVPRKSGCAKPRPPVILTPDPTLSVRFAAASWGHILRASCFDSQAFLRFATTHANQGPEFFPNDCGSELEAGGWCP